MIVRIANNLTDTAPKTFLASPEVAGTNILRLKNTNGIGSAWAIQIGETGDEQSEIKLISGDISQAGTLGTLTANTVFAHPENTPVYAIKYNQVVFEVSTAGTAGTAVQLTNGTVTITPDNLDPQNGKSYTQFDDVTGSTSYAYKTYFRNSAIPLTSTESDWIIPTGYDFYSLGKLKERVREKMWDSNFITDDQITNWVNEWKDEMSNSLISVNEDYAIGTENVAFGTNGLGTVTNATFKQPRKMEITYDGITWVLSTKQNLTEFSPHYVYSSAHPYHNWEGNNVFRVKPADSAGTAKVYFYSTGTPMVNDTDTLPVPMRAYTKSFIDYVLAMAYQKDGKISESTGKLSEALMQKTSFTDQLTPRDKTGPQQVILSEVITGDDNVFF